MHSNYLLHKKAYKNYIWAIGRKHFKGSFMEFPIKHTEMSSSNGDDLVKITEDFYQKFKVIVADSIKKDAAAKKRYEKQKSKDDEEYRRQAEARARRQRAEWGRGEGQESRKGKERRRR